MILHIRTKRTSEHPINELGDRAVDIFKALLFDLTPIFFNI